MLKKRKTMQWYFPCWCVFSLFSKLIFVFFFRKVCMYIFTYFFILLKGSFIMPETWILDSSLGKYINLYLLGLKKKKRLESQPSRFLYAFLEHNWTLLETVTSKSALHIVEERLKWTKGLFCDHMSSCFAVVRNDFAKTIVCCYWVLSQLQLNPSQTSLAKNSLCNLILEAQCILFMKWWDRSINFRVCSEMGVGRGWVCLFAVSKLSPQFLYCASLAFSIIISVQSRWFIFHGSGIITSWHTNFDWILF